jgi:pyrroloquinoline-quinone synthase
MSDFIAELDEMIGARRKTTSPLYQTILAGKATQRLLRTFTLQRLPIKRHWTRNLLGIAARIEDHQLRALYVENAYEEETGALSGSRRHVTTFEDFARAVGATDDEMLRIENFPETDAVIAHNVRTCNDTSVDFTEGAASVILLMEGQPPIVDDEGNSMLAVMRDRYLLPDWGYEFFVHHASNDATGNGVSELEDEHAWAARELLRRHCDTDEKRERAKQALATAIELRHNHFDAILREGYDPTEPVFAYQAP